MTYLKEIFTYLKGIPEDIISIYHCGVTMTEAYAVLDADYTDIHTAFFECLEELIITGGLTPETKRELDTRPRQFSYNAESLSCSVLTLWEQWKP